MVLFSSFNHLNILLLFSYMGLVSGLVFFLVFNVSQKIKSKNTKAVKGIIAKKKENKQSFSKKLSTKQEAIVDNVVVTPSLKYKAKEKKQKKQVKEKNLIKERKTRLKAALLKVQQNIILFFKRTQNILLTILCIIALVVVVLGSYYLNFIYNYGYLRVSFVVVWLLSFFIWGHVQKKVAKLLSTFYNKTCKQRFGLKKTKEQSDKPNV